MCSNCSGDYENPDATNPVAHGFAGMDTIEKNIVTSGYAEMDVEYPAYLCHCGEKFQDKEEFRLHVMDNCPHTDEVRWEPSRGAFECLKCNEYIDIPELETRDQDVAVKL